MVPATLALAPLVGLLLAGDVACRCGGAGDAQPVDDPSVPTAPEVAVQRLALAGDASARELEFSGLAWYKDQLVLIPQYPAGERGDAGGRLFVLPRDEVLARVDAPAAAREALRPRAISFETAALRERVSGFQGFEAVAFAGERAVFTIESWGASAVGHVVEGRVLSEPAGAGARATVTGIELELETLRELPTPAKIFNAGFEGVVYTPDGVLALYERNSASLNPNARATLIGPDGEARALSVPALEYRLTDATALDERGRFWVINYRFPGSEDGVSPVIDGLARAHGRGESHKRSTIVERLLELEYSAQGLTLTERAPIVLQLSGVSRNWEGVARLEGRGLLIVTDKFPETMLGYVPLGT